MANHWKCIKCGSMNVERKQYKRFEAESTLYKSEEVSFGTKEEEIVEGFLFCKDCKNLEGDKFVLMPDTD
jgi:predicted nucleic-acid-binding Zn-ribbon protein